MFPHLSQAEKGLPGWCRLEDPIRKTVPKASHLLPFTMVVAAGSRFQASFHVALLKLHSNSIHSGAYVLLPALWVPESCTPWAKQQLETKEKAARLRKPCYTIKERWMEGSHLKRYKEPCLGNGTQLEDHRDGSDFSILFLYPRGKAGSWGTQRKGIFRSDFTLQF